MDGPGSIGRGGSDESSRRVKGEVVDLAAEGKVGDRSVDGFVAVGSPDADGLVERGGDEVGREAGFGEGRGGDDRSDLLGVALEGGEDLGGRTVVDDDGLVEAVCEGRNRGQPSFALTCSNRQAQTHPPVTMREPDLARSRVAIPGGLVPWRLGTVAD